MTCTAISGEMHSFKRFFMYPYHPVINILCQTSGPGITEDKIREAFGVRKSSSAFLRLLIATAISYSD